MTSLRQNPPADSSGRAPYPLFLDSKAGRLFAFHYSANPNAPAHLLLPPFGEEMNRCRMFMNDLARAYHRHGHNVLILDLFGTGESEGAFKDANWDIWLEDVEAAKAFLKEKGCTTLHFLAIRLGTLLALESMEGVASAAFIAPECNGERFIHQLIRARIVAENFITSQYGGQPSTRAVIEQEFSQQGFSNLLGYEISQELVAALRSRKEDIPNSAQYHLMNIQGMPQVWAQMEPQSTRSFAEQLIKEALGS